MVLEVESPKSRGHIWWGLFFSLWHSVVNGGRAEEYMRERENCEWEETECFYNKPTPAIKTSIQEGRAFLTQSPLKVPTFQHCSTGNWVPSPWTVMDTFKPWQRGKEHLKGEMMFNKMTLESGQVLWAPWQIGLWFVQPRIRDGKLETVEGKNIRLAVRHPVRSLPSGGI